MMSEFHLPSNNEDDEIQSFPFNGGSSPLHIASYPLFDRDENGDDFSWTMRSYPFPSHENSSTQPASPFFAVGDADRDTNSTQMTEHDLENEVIDETAAGKPASSDIASDTNNILAIASRETAAAKPASSDIASVGAGAALRRSMRLRSARGSLAQMSPNPHGDLDFVNDYNSCRDLLAGKLALGQTFLSRPANSEGAGHTVDSYKNSHLNLNNSLKSAKNGGGRTYLLYKGVTLEQFLGAFTFVHNGIPNATDFTRYSGFGIMEFDPTNPVHVAAVGSYGDFKELLASKLSFAKDWRQLSQFLVPSYGWMLNPKTPGALLR